MEKDKTHSILLSVKLKANMDQVTNTVEQRRGFKMISIPGKAQTQTIPGYCVLKCSMEVCFERWLFLVLLVVCHDTGTTQYHD